LDKDSIEVAFEIRDAINALTKELRLVRDLLDQVVAPESVERNRYIRMRLVERG
jgi:hypothetical protein